MKIIEVLAVILLLCVFSISAQVPEKTAAQHNQRLSKIVRKSGWKIPNIRGAKVSSEKSFDIDGSSVTEKKYNVRDREIPLKIESYSLALDKTLSVTESPYDCEIYTISSYISKNRIFAYKLSCVPFEIRSGVATVQVTKAKQKSVEVRAKFYAGAMFTFYYFDENGDGIFETKYDESEMPRTLPEWIKK